MLDRLNQSRAISLKDGGRAGEDTFRAQISVRSRFVLHLRLPRRIAIAGLSATFLLAGVMVGGSASVSRAPHRDCRLVSPLSDGCARSAAEGADTGSDPASHGAPGSGSQRNKAPREPNSGTWGRQR
jgi:hypothetical protein